MKLRNVCILVLSIVASSSFAIELETTVSTVTNRNTIERPSLSDVDAYVDILNMISERPISVEYIQKRIDKLGVLDGVIIPTLLEMDYLLADGNIRGANYLNVAMSKLDKKLTSKLHRKFGLSTQEYELGNSAFGIAKGPQFQRSFGTDTFRFDERDSGERDFGNIEMLAQNSQSPIFGNPSLRNDIARMSRGGSCVAGCGAGAPMGGAIGSVIGGIVGGVTTGPVGVVPAANAGGLVGGVVGCAVGCIAGPPQTTAPAPVTTNIETPKAHPAPKVSTPKVEQPTTAPKSPKSEAPKSSPKKPKENYPASKPKETKPQKKSESIKPKPKKEQPKNPVKPQNEDSRTITDIDFDLNPGPVDPSWTEIQNIQNNDIENVGDNRLNSLINFRNDVSFE